MRRLLFKTQGFLLEILLPEGDSFGRRPPNGLGGMMVRSGKSKTESALPTRRHHFSLLMKEVHHG